MSADDIRAAFGEAVTLVDGALGGYARPSTIRDLASGEVLRD
jgi:L-threonylcarbamoyladenylate synthase